MNRSVLLFTRRQFAAMLAGGVALLLGGWRFVRARVATCVTRAMPGRYPGAVRPLDEAAARKPGRWAG